MTLVATAALLFGVGAGYLYLLGTAVSVVALPRRWLPLAPLVAPFLGWAALVAVGYPLNTVLPFRLVALLLGVAGGAGGGAGRLAGRLRWRAACSRRGLREALPPWLLGLAGTWWPWWCTPGRGPSPRWWWTWTWSTSRT